MKQDIPIQTRLLKKSQLTVRLLGSGLIFAAALLVGCEKRKTVEVTVTPPAVEKTADGTLLRSEMAGIISEIYVKQGEKVSAGTVLARLDRGRYDSKVKDCEVDVFRAKMEITSTKMTRSLCESERVSAGWVVPETFDERRAREREGLPEKKADAGKVLAAENAVKDAVLAYETALDNLAKKTGELKELQAKEAQLEIKSPIDGTVSKVGVGLGASVGPNGPVLFILH